MLFGILFIDAELWIEDISFSTETLATLFVVLPAISHKNGLNGTKNYRAVACVLIMVPILYAAVESAAMHMR